jgi:hypothetical protein
MASVNDHQVAAFLLLRNSKLSSVHSYYMSQTHCILVKGLLASLFATTDFIVTISGSGTNVNEASQYYS